MINILGITRDARSVLVSAPCGLAALMLLIEKPTAVRLFEAVQLKQDLGHRKCVHAFHGRLDTFMSRINGLARKNRIEMSESEH